MSTLNLSRIRLYIFSALVIGAPLSFVPSVALPLLNFPSFRIGLYQLLATVFVAISLIPTLKFINKSWQTYHIPSLALLLLALASAIGIVHATDTSRSALLIASVLLLIALVACSWWFVSTQITKVSKKFIAAFLLSGVVFAGLALLQLLYGTVFDTGGFLCKGCRGDIFGFPRVNATAAEPLFFANALLPVFAFSLWLSIKKYPLAYISLLATSITIGLTFARGAYLAAAVATLVVFIFAIKHKMAPLKHLGLTLVLLFFSGIIALTMLTASATVKYYDTTPNITYNTIRSSLEHMTLGIIVLPERTIIVEQNTNLSDDFVSPGLIEASTNERTGSAELAIKALTYSPVQFFGGTALGSLGPFVVENIDANAPYTLTVYIFYILFLAEIGLFGFIAYLIVIAYIIVKLYRKQFTISLSVPLLALLAAFLTQYFFFGSYINVIYIWMWLGVMLAFATTTHKQLPDILHTLRIHNEK